MRNIYMIEQAIQHHRQGELEAAGNMYRAMLDEEPENFEVMHLYGILQHDAGKLAEAISLVRKAIALEPEGGAFHNTLGMFLQKTGDTRAARASFSMAIEKNPNIAHAYNNLGYLQLAAGEFDEAEKTLRIGLKLEPEFAEALTNLGNVLIELGQNDEATKQLKQATTLAPESAAAQASLGRAFLAQNAPSLAVQCLNNALNRRPHYYSARMLLGRAHAQEGDLDGAITAYKLACEQLPDAVEPRMELAAVCRQAGRYGEALVAYQHILTQRPDSPEFAMAVGDTYAESGDSEAAMKCFQATVLHDPRSADAHIRLGRELRRCGYYAEAIDSLSTARDLRPADSQPLAELAMALELDGQTQLAVATADQALQIDAAQPDAVLVKARAELAAGDAQAAVARLSAVCEQDLLPQQRRCMLVWLGRAHDAAGRYDDAWQAFGACNRERKAAGGGMRIVQPKPPMASSALAALPAEAPADGRPAPVFLVGYPGSGVDQLAHALAQHARIAVLHDRVKGGADRRDFLSMADELENPAVADETDTRLQRRKYWRAIQQLTGADPQQLTWVDRLAPEVTRLDLIYRYFPDARVLLVRRHSSDHLLQCFADGDLAGQCGDDIELVRQQIEDFAAGVRELRKQVPLACHGIDSGLLHTDYQGLMRDVLAFLKVEWDDRAPADQYQRIAEPALFEPGHWQKYQEFLAAADLSKNGK